MNYRNDGRGEIDSLQNRFTAYLRTAVERYTKHYLDQLHTLWAQEPSHDFQEQLLERAEEPDMLAGLSLMDTTENTALLHALQSLTPRDLEVVLDMVFYDKRPADLAGKLGLSYHGAMAVYYRALKKLRKHMEQEGSHEF